MYLCVWSRQPGSPLTGSVCGSNRRAAVSQGGDEHVCWCPAADCAGGTATDRSAGRLHGRRWEQALGLAINAATVTSSYQVHSAKDSNVKPKYRRVASSLSTSAAAGAACLPPSCPPATAALSRAAPTFWPRRPPVAASMGAEASKPRAPAALRCPDRPTRLAALSCAPLPGRCREKVSLHEAGDRHGAAHSMVGPAPRAGRPVAPTG